MHSQGKTQVGNAFILLVALVALLSGCPSANDNSDRTAGSKAGNSSPTAGAPSDNSPPTAVSASSNDKTVWARSLVSVQSASSFDSVAADGAGNVYAAGNLWGPGSVDFGNGVTLTAVSDGYDALLMKYDASGTALWAQTITSGSNRAEFYSLAIDKSDHIYVAGYVYGSAGPADFGNGVTFAKSDAFMNAVLVAYDSSGRALWVQAVTGGSSQSSFNAVTVDAAGSVYVAGQVDGTGTYDFGHEITVTGVANADGLLNPPDNAVLVKYDSSGAAQWAQTIRAGSPASSFGAVAVDATGNVYTAGSIAGTGSYDFGNGVTLAGTSTATPIARESAASALIVKYSGSGIAQWARTPMAGSDGSSFASIAVDATGNMHVAGSIGEGTYDFGNGVTVTGSVKDGSFTGTAGSLFTVVATYDASGIAQWARTVSPAGSNSYLTSVAVDSSGNVYVSGGVSSTGTYDFGNAVTIATSAAQAGYNAAVVKYAPSGVAQWAHSCANSGSSEDIFNALTVDPSGNLYAAGVIGGAGSADFGNDVSVMGPQVGVGPGWSPLLVKY
jgi:hypothetical protein